MKIISHRGGAKIAAENSIDAIKVSKSLGVDAVEIDIRVTKDNQLVVFHDKDLNRLANINKKISDLQLSEIKKIKLTNNQYIPTIDEAVEASGEMPLVIEGKGDNWAKILSDRLTKYPNSKSYRIISFNKDELAKFRSLSPDYICYYIAFWNTFKAISVAKKFGFEGIVVQFLALNPLTYRFIRNANLKVGVYTVNSRFIANLKSHFYPQMEVTSDRPDKLVKLTKGIEK